MNTKYLKLGLILLPLLFVGILFLLPDKTLKTDEDIPQEVVDWVNKELTYSGDLHVIKDKGATIHVRWTDPATAPPGDPPLDVYHVLSDPYNEKKTKTEQTMHAIILRNNNPSSVTVSLVEDTISYDVIPQTICEGDGAHSVWIPTCKPAGEVPSAAGGVFTWSGSWEIVAYGQRVFRYTHDSSVTNKGECITSTTHVVSSGESSPSDEGFDLADDEKCTPPFYGFSFDNIDWYSAYPEDGSADYYDPGTYDNKDFYFEIEIASDQGSLTVDNATLTFPESWNVVSCACASDPSHEQGCSCSVNEGPPDTVTFSGPEISGEPDGWKWLMKVDLPQAGGHGVVEVTDWGTVTHGNCDDCNGPYTKAGYVEFPIYVTAFNNPPTVPSVNLIPYPSITVNENSTITATCTATIEDLDGGDKIVSATATIYRSGVTATSSCSQDNDNCYQDITCSLSDPDVNNKYATCTADIWFHADPTDVGTYSDDTWQCYVIAEDDQGATGYNTDGDPPELNTLNAVIITSSIDYGLLAPGATSSASQTTIATTTGNAALDLLASSTDMYYGAITIPGNKQAYSLNGDDPYESMTPVSTTSYVTIHAELIKPTQSPSDSVDTIYWKVGIPEGQTLGTYYSTTSIVATPDTP